MRRTALHLGEALRCLERKPEVPAFGEIVGDFGRLIAALLVLAVLAGTLVDILPAG